MPAILGLEHITKQGERLDLLAWRYYGDAADISGLVEANPSLPLTPVLPSGLKVVVPLKARAATAQAQANLPPWKRPA